MKRILSRGTPSSLAMMPLTHSLSTSQVFIASRKAATSAGTSQRHGQDALELEDRLLVEDDGVEVGGRMPGLLEAVLDGERGERGVVLLAAEALFLRGGHERPS